MLVRQGFVVGKSAIDIGEMEGACRATVGVSDDASRRAARAARDNIADREVGCLSIVGKLGRRMNNQFVGIVNEEILCDGHIDLV